MPQLEQVAANAVAKYQSRTVKATFARPTTPGSLIVVVCAAAGTLPSNLTAPGPGFQLIRGGGLRDIQQSVWYRQAAPSITSVEVTALDDNKSLQLRALEYSGMAQANVLDKVAFQLQENDSPSTGASGTTAQGDEVVLAFVTNQYASTSQYGWTGGLTRLYETTSPQSSRWRQEDWERSRLTVHQSITTATGNFALAGRLSSSRRWIGLLVTFRGQSTGPARFTSTQRTGVLGTRGSGALTVFGPLRSTVQTNVLRTGGRHARVGPFNYQYRLGGFAGLLIGDETEYTIESHDGLEGWEIRTSDDELPRGDGALRGVDLQSARQILIKLKVGGRQVDVEAAMDVLYRALVPQRDTDFELIWRHPGRPLRMVRVRPVNLTRELSWEETVVNHQAIALIAADPRHYSAGVHSVRVPATAEQNIGAIIPVVLLNEGNGAAYPLIRIAGPPLGSEPVTRVELVNQSGDVSFVVETVLPAGSTLVGDMEARATGAARSVVTVDGQPKYGGWVHPRTTFRLAPGSNRLYLRTTPATAQVTATIEYRDTWSG